MERQRAAGEFVAPFLLSQQKHLGSGDGWAKLGAVNVI